MTYSFEPIGSRMKELRKEKGYSLAKVAECCGIQQYQTVSSWESGNTTPSLKNLFQMCELYGCELGYLLGEYDCKTRKTADIKAETGLSEKSIERLKTEKNFNPQYTSSVNTLLEFNNGDIVKLITDYLTYEPLGKAIEHGNLIITDDSANDFLLLEILAELKNCREKQNGGKN